MSKCCCLLLQGQRAPATRAQASLAALIPVTAPPAPPVTRTPAGAQEHAPPTGPETRVREVTSFLQHRGAVDLHSDDS